jgi:hypothetical protein
MFPSGRAKLVTNPSPSASELAAMTIGIVRVAFLAARVDAEDPATMRSTFSWISSATSAGSRSTFPSGESKLDKDIFAVDPASLAQRLTKAASGSRAVSAVFAPRNAIRGTFAACCATPASGTTMVPLTIAAINRRRFTIGLPRCRTRPA